MQASSKRSRFSRGGTPHRVSSSSPASRGFASGTERTATRVTWGRSTPGCACTRTTRSPQPTGRMRGSQPATRRRFVAFRSGSRTSMRLRGSRSRRPVACSTRCPGVRARRGPVSRPLGWCCSATCTRTSSLRAGRPTRWAIPGPSTARPAARVAARQQRSQRAWSPPRRARTRPVLCASHRPSAAPRRSSRPAERCRPAGSCRSARPSTMPGRWRGASRTAHRCSLRWRMGAGYSGERRSGASRSPRGSGWSTSTPTSPTASTPP